MNSFDRWRSVVPGLIDTVIRDLRYGLRFLRRSPIFTTVAIVSLALGIGANAAIFQLIDTIRLRSLAIANPQELAEVRADGPEAFGSYESVNSKATYPLWELIHANQSAFSAMFAWGDTQFIVGRGADARSARGLWVSGDFFQVLGIAPEHGRLLGPGDDRRGCGAGSAVVSHAFWQGPLGGRESAVGSTLTVLDQPFVIAGVTPASFTGRRLDKRSTLHCRSAPRRCGTPASSNGIAGG
jgi:putative ABC transport system permease protein